MGWRPTERIHGWTTIGVKASEPHSPQAWTRQQISWAHASLSASERKRGLGGKKPVLNIRFRTPPHPQNLPEPLSERGRIRFRRVRFQTPSSVSFLGLTEFRGASSVSSCQPVVCGPKRTHRVSRRTHRACRRTQRVLSSETVLSKQYSARSLLWGFAGGSCGRVAE